ncbi:alpha/beta hydrolase [Pseudomonas vanderleydeniana]|uniref:Alpha/beta hydrolase n=2 Tax=Pseudomonas vanderleydeniana TaxID=2745495 RepID=A0A9E6PSN6_9PSED|nr:alpha/beta hydrolase [Pseudomonas vanderleydeniana]
MLMTGLVSGCASVPSPESRSAAANELARSHHWQGQQIDSQPFPLKAFRPEQFSDNPRLTIYLEGDGFAWVTASQPSTDPTPIDPVALRLALAQPSGNAAYLARPCQYLKPAACSRDDWTDARFSADVVSSLDRAVDTLKQQAHAQTLQLVGYSGGAAIALLLAARRTDVENVITVAGNLDHQAWTRFHRVQPLTRSLNPGDFGPALSHLRQMHLVGTDDPVIPPELTRQFVTEHPSQPAARVQVMPGYNHHCCWAEHWAELWPTLDHH